MLYKSITPALLLGSVLLLSSTVLFAQSESAEGSNYQTQPDGAMAQDHAQVLPTSVAEMAEPEDETLKAVFHRFRGRFPALNIDDISVAPMLGLFEVITDSRLVYVDENVDFLFQGSLIDLEEGVDLSESRLALIHMDLINDLGEGKMLVYNAVPASDRSITVFTDINCGYCRLLHSEIDVLLSNGVNVRYLMFPRAGLESDSRVALESVWCADDPQEAMTVAKAGGAISPVACTTPIEEHYDIAGRVGLRGTPLIYLDNGVQVPGYREASALIEMIHTSEPM